MKKSKENRHKSARKPKGRKRESVRTGKTPAQPAEKTAAAKTPESQVRRTGTAAEAQGKTDAEKSWRDMTPEEIEALPFKMKRLIMIRRRHENMKREIEMIREDLENDDEED